MRMNCKCAQKMLNTFKCTNSLKKNANHHGRKEMGTPSKFSNIY